MKTLIKTLTVTDGQMNVIKAGRRIPLLQFSGNIEIFETQTAVNILGKLSKGIKKIYASFILCDDIEYSSEDEIHTLGIYEATAVVQGEQNREKLLFAGLRFEDSDPITGGLTFEVTDSELIKKMLEM